MLYFLVFFSFCDDFINWEYCCESAIIYSMDGNPPVPFNRSLPLHERGATTQTICVFLRLWSMSFKLLENTTLFLFLMHLYSSTSSYVARFQDYWIPYILAIMLIQFNKCNYEKCSIVMIRQSAIFSNWGAIQLISVIKARGTCHFRFHCVLYKLNNWKFRCYLAAILD